MKSMGGIGGLLDKLPGMGQMAQMAQQQVNDKSVGQMEAIICSMTPKERRYPDVINNSRKRRIEAGSGTQIQEVNRLLKRHKKSPRWRRKLGKKGEMATR